MREPAMASRQILFFSIGLSVWIVTVVIVSVLVFIAPMKRSVVPVYHEAAENWTAQKSLYLETKHAYFYFPQFALMFVPFHYLPMPFGDMLWRILQSALFITGLWRIVNLSASTDKGFLFLCVSAIAIASCIGAIRNGQANVLIAALMIHSAVSLARSQWWLAAFCMGGALAVKPLALVFIVLAVIAYHSTIPRLALIVCIFIVLPFLFADSAYVLSQYGEALRQLLSSSLTTEHRFADINGLLRSLGIGLSGFMSQVVRVIAGASIAVLWWISAKRMGEPERSLMLLAFAATYLMLFNPMTEPNGYIIVIPSIAFYAVYYLKTNRLPVLGWSLVFIGLSIGVIPELLRSWVQNMGLWWNPLMMVFFSAFLVWKTFAAEPSLPVHQNTPPRT